MITREIITQQLFLAGSLIFFGGAVLANDWMGSFGSFLFVVGSAFMPTKNKREERARRVMRNTPGPDTR